MKVAIACVVLAWLAVLVMALSKPPTAPPADLVASCTLSGGRIVPDPRVGGRLFWVWTCMPKGQP